ncbi:MAG: hypothetical protein ABIP55_13020 [Tepidisphaeraceae bacterium]
MQNNPQHNPPNSPPHDLPNNPLGAATTAARFLGTAFGLVFFGIGVTVIGFMWFGDDGFGSPPVFVKVFASFIALGFIAMGGTLAASAFFGAGMLNKHGATIGEAMKRAKQTQADTRATDKSPSASPGSYACPQCGAAIGEKPDVSPMGDTRCAFCGRWFNVHGRSA